MIKRGDTSHLSLRVLDPGRFVKATLAYMPEERVDDIIDRHGMERYTGQTITSRAERFDDLAAVRDRGYAIDNGEKISGLRCIAAPVLSNEPP